jgi:trimeric autotransporter adhesin
LWEIIRYELYIFVYKDNLFQDKLLLTDAGFIEFCWRKIMKHFIYATALIACFGSFTAQAVTLPIIADSYVATSAPTVNYGIATSLKVNANNKTLLRFNSSTLPSAVVSTDIYKATLVFHNQVTTGGAVQIRTLSGAWTETGVSYNTLPGVGVVAANNVLVNNLANYTTVDITNLIKNWLLAPSTNFGLLIEPDALYPSTDVTFDSQENTLTSHAAYIEVVLRGQTGAKGDRGLTGSQGLQGLRGLTGPQGPMGLPGPRGFTGLQGIQGLRGLTGATGSRGPMGVPGPNTPNGNITLLPSSSVAVGNIFKNANSFIHNYGSNNTFIGELAGNFTTTGTENTALGKSALAVVTTGSFNIAAGFEGLTANTTGQKNSAFGLQALKNNLNGNDNEASGFQSMYSNISGNDNLANGMWALYSNTTGSNNVALGYRAGFNLTTGSGNIDIGNQGVAGEANIIRIGTAQTDTYLTGIIHGNGSGLTNVPVFTGSLVGDITGTQGATVVSSVGGSSAANINLATVAANTATHVNTINTLIKRDASGNFSAGTVTASLDGNVYKGANLFLHSFGTGNSFVGENAGNLTMTGGYNVATGNAALQTNTTGQNNVATGIHALLFNTTGNNNTANGFQSMRSNTIGHDNAGMGMWTLYLNTTGNYNTANGEEALYNNTSGSSNIGLGYLAGYNLTTGSNNIDIGNQGVAGESNIIRIGTAQTDTYLTGVIHGDGSGLTGLASSVNFSGSLVGDVTGTQGATVVASVGGSTAANVNLATVAANAATNLNTVSTIVKRDASGNFLTTGVTLSGNLTLPATTATTGIIYKGANPFLHNFGGSSNLFVGENAGNLTMTGGNNVGTGFQTLLNNTTGNLNVAVGVSSLFWNSTGAANVAVGVSALNANATGSNNTAVGRSAMRNNTGSNNIALGFQAGQNLTTGSGNIDIGHLGVAAESNIIRIGTAQTDTYLAGVIHGDGSGLTNLPSSGVLSDATFNTKTGTQSLFSNTTGYNNVANGYQSLYWNTTGYENTANGYMALAMNDSGFQNVANGLSALYSNTTGSNNVAIGNAALYANTDSGFNTAVGDHALSSVTTTGWYNTAVGYNALANLNTIMGGSSNTAIGNGADVGALPISNATAIGNGAIVMASNKVRIGNDFITEIGGQVGWSSLSDKRLKTNIIKSNKGLDFILKLQPVTYQWKKGDTKTVYDGFIAQDIEAAIKAAGFTSFSALHKPQNIKDHYSLEYSTFVVPLVNAVKEENALIKQQAAINKQQATEIAALKAQVAQLTALFNAQHPK